MELDVRDDSDELIEGLRELEWLEEHPDYRERPAGFRDFCLSPYYLGLDGVIYRKLIDIGEMVATGNFNEFIFKAGLGSGKSFLVSAMMCYGAHLLLCLKSPHKYFKLTDDKPITLIAMGIREAQVKKTVFSSLKNFVAKSPFFRQFVNKIMTTSIELDIDALGGGEFPRIEMICGNSSETAAIGLNLFMGILDEADFFIDNKDQSDAEEIYSTITTRIASRFGRNGLAMAISSPLHDESFMNKKEIEAKENPETMYCVSMPTWKGKDREKMERDVFIFDSEKMIVVPKDGKYFDGKEEFNLPITPDKAKTLQFSTPELNNRFWIIPMDFYSTFKRNPERASRDLGAKSFRSNDVFIKLPQFIDNAFVNDLPNIATPEGWKVPHTKITNEGLYAHIDMGLNRENQSGEGDACGIAVGYFDGYDKDHEGRAKVKIIALERILRSEIAGEIEFKDVRARLFALHNAGYQFNCVSIDGWQCLRRGTKISIVNRSKSQYNENMKKGSKLKLLNSQSKEIQDLVEGDYVYSLDSTGNVKAGKVKAVWCSGKKTLWKITLNNDKVIECSGNHPFLLRSGVYARADELKSGDSLMPLYIHNNKPYQKVYNPRSDSYVLTHRLIAQPKRHEVVHHLDHNTYNNDPRNLKIMTKSEHSKEHWNDDRKVRTSILMKETNKKYGLMGYHGPHGDSTKIKIKETLKRKWETDKEYIEMMKSRPVYTGEKASKFDKSFTIDDIIPFKNETLSATAVKLNVSKPKIRRRLEIAGYNSWKEFQESITNHKVVSVECLNIQDEVWDIEVEGYHNFGLEAGVFVHNSTDTIQTFNAHGIPCEELSVDRTVAPYEAVKEAMYENRLKSPRIDIVVRELQKLQVVKGKKIDHPKHESKDCADAIAGVVYKITQDYGADPSLGLSGGSITFG